MQRIQECSAGAIGLVDSGRTLTDALGTVLGGQPVLTPQQRGAIQDICYGTMRHRAELLHVLRQLVPNALPEPALEHLLLVSLYQLYYTRAASHAVVNQAVSLAGRTARGRFKGVVNGTLRNALRRRDALMAAVQLDDEARFNHPRWWLEMLRETWPDDWCSIVDADNAHPPMTLRINPRRTDMATMLARFEAEGVKAAALDDQGLMLDMPCPVAGLPGFAEGSVSVQDWGAQQAARRLDLADGLRVLDACAAPGGKTCHMLELADLDLTALDVDASRLGRVRENLDRQGLSARLLAGDAGRPDVWWDGRQFDRILADVPCSASGVVRRNPDIRWLRRPSDFSLMARQQAAILDALWPLLASGGKMLYATCSIHPEENSRQIDAFLQRQADALCQNQEQLLPAERHDGFYYALLEKR
jgi:16S rRNA (cytosine967-C5)-methyltransferase